MTIEEAKAKKALYDKKYRANSVVSERIKAYQKQYYLNNKEKKQQYYANLYQSKPNVIKERTKQYYLLNSKKRNAKKSEWKKSNKDKVAFYTANRRAQELQATPKWANKFKIAEFYKTADGLSMITGIWYHVDHIIPLKSKLVCGLHTHGNLRVITAKENLSKFNNFTG